MSFLFSKKPKKEPTRLFYATDIHGSERTYRKFINAGKFYDVNVIVMGGDIQGKLMIPIIREPNGHHRATVQGRVEHLETDEELKALMGKLDILGFYYKVMEEDEFRVLKPTRRLWKPCSTSLPGRNSTTGSALLRNV